MEYEQFDVNPSYIEELLECSSKTAVSFQAEVPIFPDVISGFLEDEVMMERLLEMEKDLMDFDSIDQDAVVDIESAELDQEFQENGNAIIDRNSHIQEQIMEETGLTELLLMGAEAVEAKNWSLSSTIIAKLNDLLFDRENDDNPFKRLALFFTQGLHFKSVNAPEMRYEPVPGRTNSASAFQMMQELSPYLKFAHFTANQAILEASLADQQIHIVDFHIMEGIQWPPLMVDLAMRKDTSLRVTAIISDQQNEKIVQETGRRLKEYADSINLPFVFDQMEMVTEEDFERIEVGHTLIANCMMHQLHIPNKSTFPLIKTFINGMIKLSPKIFVLVEEELFNFARIPSMSFVEFFCEAIHYYNALSDSLLSSFFRGYKMGLRLIEKEILGSRILDSLRQFPCEKNERLLWGDGFAPLKGFRPIPMSSSNISQAKFLVSLFGGGYSVQHEHCRLALCWKSRPLTIASIWVSRSKSRQANVNPIW